MDTTPKYIKMCEKAEEIQELWQFEDGDFYLHRFPDKGGQFASKEVVMTLCPPCNVKDSYGDTYVSEYSPKGENVWLLRQDQLQEMVDEYTAGSYLTLLKMLIKFVDRDGASVYGHCYTPEQLWLTFVMKEKFNKVWDDKKEEWIKI